jgi:subtilisin family serine protease
VAVEGVAPAREPPSGGTGRYLVTLRDDAAATPERSLRDLAGLRTARSADLHDMQARQRLAGDADAIVFDRLGVALVTADPTQAKALQASGARIGGAVLAVEPEQYLAALGRFIPDATGEPAVDASQWPGRLAGGALGNLAVGPTAPQPDLATMTWGVQVTQAWKSPASGAGIRMAVLDTGFDLQHPDFAGRDIVPASFVPGLAVQDRHGHGTHTAGTACGPLHPPGGARRYGIAPAATLLVGKVLDDAGFCEEGWLLAGLDWALRQRADIVSMSLGWHVAPGEGYKFALERAGRAALDAGCVLLAAAGNEARQPVYRPANCPSIFAVGALDNSLRRADFSCVARNGDGGELDLAAPGVGVWSSAPMPARYRWMEGTSMATPHVAGCAALWAENHGLRGRALWAKLLEWVRPLGESQEEVGRGLVQAPW